MPIEEFHQLIAQYGFTAKENYKDYWMISLDGKHYVAIGNPVTLTLSPDQWHTLLQSIAENRVWRMNQEAKRASGKVYWYKEE